MKLIEITQVCAKCGYVGTTDDIHKDVCEDCWDKVICSDCMDEGKIEVMLDVDCFEMKTCHCQLED